jgi:predicted amidohydrolase YtcJ
MDWIWRWSEDPQTLELAYELANGPSAWRTLYPWPTGHWAASICGTSSMTKPSPRPMAGSAIPNPYVIPGASLHRELELLVEAGLTPMQALRAATQVAAELLGQEARLGTLAEGKVADFVILDGNPLADIRQIRQVEGVLREGQIVWKK